MYLEWLRIKLSEVGTRTVIYIIDKCMYQQIKSWNPIGDARSARRLGRAVWVIAPSQSLR